jgi:hypothetical protein
MGGCCLEGHITDPRKMTMEEKSRRQRRKKRFLKEAMTQKGL